MEKLRIVLLITGCFFILFGYFRFITDKKGNVNLNNYRFTGGIFMVIGGMVDGTRDLFSTQRTPKRRSALAIYIGLLLFIIGFSL
jgi:hypothetical protein